MNAEGKFLPLATEQASRKLRTLRPFAIEFDLLEFVWQ
jgi:hypothetical protein